LVGVLTWVGIALFGALGAVARFRLDGAVSARFPSDFPLGIMAVNLSGAFALGALNGAAAPHRVLSVLGTGFMGGYTTFSTWMIETERLGEDGELLAAFANIAVSMLAGLGIAAVGFYLAQAVA
jgi:CrcB protein